MHVRRDRWTRWTKWTCACAFIALAASVPAAPREPTLPTALDQLVHGDVDDFAWSTHGSRREGACTVHWIRMTSGTWRSEAEVSPHVWHHWIRVLVPDVVESDVALLLVSGGIDSPVPPRRDQPPDIVPASRLPRGTAELLGSIVVEVFSVPAQPTTFLVDGDGATPVVEDWLVARSWALFLDTGEPDWIAQLPMTRATVRAMDAVQAALLDEEGKPLARAFVLTGGCKRGWAAWLAAAVDDRVVGVAPIAADLTGVRENLLHQRRIHGAWPVDFGPFEECGVPDRMHEPRFQELLDIADPASLGARLDIPKLFVSAAGDGYFAPDSTRFYLHRLAGRSHARLVANDAHTLQQSDALITVGQFHRAVALGKALPEMDWSIAREEGVIRATAGTEPLRALLVTARNEHARDFRFATTGRAWDSIPVAIGEGPPWEFSVPIAAPRKGWAAAFLEVHFADPCGGPLPMILTTEALVVPDALFPGDEAR